jgi:Bardet-Biedl syndrome 2 protein
VLLVGTNTDLLAYDVDENKDHFFKDVPDGVNAMLCGRFGQQDAPMARVDPSPWPPSSPAPSNLP